IILSGIAKAEDALIVLKSDDIAEMELTKTYIEGLGDVKVVFPTHFMIADIEDTKGIKNDNILDVYTGRVDKIDYEGSEIVLSYWNQKFDARAFSRSSRAVIEVDPINDDARKMPIELGKDKYSAPGYYETSEYLYGDVVISLVFLESNGAIDTSTEDWSSFEKNNAINEIIDGLVWWEDLAPANVDLAIYLLNEGSVDTSYEPISRTTDEEGLWINEAIENLGFPGSNYFLQTFDYNNFLRDYYNTDWAFTVFIVDSSADANGLFSDGYFAYSYLYGPFLVMTYDNDGYGISNMDAVMAHEVGHIFGAGDEYASSGCFCTEEYGFLNVENQNCENSCLNDESCIMRGQVSPFFFNNLDEYTMAQVGWRDLDGDGINDVLDSTYNNDPDSDGDGIVDYWDTENDLLARVLLLEQKVLDLEKLNISKRVSDLENLSINNTLENLTKRVEDLENQTNNTLNNITKRIVFLENFTTFIEDQMESVKQYIFFWSYIGLCEAIEGECVITPPTTTTTTTSTTTTTQPTTTTTTTQAERVVFRTNVDVNKAIKEYAGINNWIAFDIDNDGILEGLGFRGNYINTDNCYYYPQVGTVPNGYPLISNNNQELFVCPSKSRRMTAYLFSTIGVAAGSAELSEDPTEPYASNGQEVIG
ncbi:MAG: hypothetical protein ABII01_04740, partial [Candidatus Woesearchaeota archaeon]